MELHNVTTICALLFMVLVIFPQSTEELARRKSLNHRSRFRRGVLHIPPLDVPTFQRDSVERLPEWQQGAHSDRSASLTNYEEFGTRSLPLRAAVEAVPERTISTRRLPLRDAVEKRPPPDEPLELDDNNDFRDNLPYQADNFVPTRSPIQYHPQQHAYVPTNTQLQTFYTPWEHFRRIVGDIGSPFDHRLVQNQQYHEFSPKYYSQNPFLMPRGRSLFSSDPRLRTQKYSEISETIVPFEQEDTDRVVCYVQGAAAYRKQPMNFNPDDLDPFACTHVIYAFASIDPHNFNMISNDDEFDIIQGGYLSVTGLKRINPKLKVLISVGERREDGSRRFSNMISSSSRRRDFIRSAISIIQDYGFDGMDLFWEYPGAQELGGHLTDKEYLNLFLEELSEIFRSKGWLLTVAGPASRFRVEDGFYPERLGELVDFVNLQAYDFHRDRNPVADHHTNLNARPQDSGLDLFLSVDYAVRFWLKKGLPRSKLVLGIPFFGRSFTLQYYNETQPGAPIKGPGREGFYTQNRGLLAYFEICYALSNEGWQKEVDESGAPYAVYGDQWVGYDGPESIEKKIQYVKQEKLGGVSIWSADMDDSKGLCGEKWPLLSVILKYFAGAKRTRDSNIPAQPHGTCSSDQADGLYSDPKNCASYFVCRNGLSYHLSCGIQLMFDPTTGRCDYIPAEKCKPGQSVYIAPDDGGVKDIDDNSLDNMARIKDNKPKVVCYMTNWAFYRKAEGKFVPEHIDQRLCTHVIYAYASLDPEKLLIKEFDPWADLDNNLYERVTSLPDPEVLLGLGGWTDSAGDKYSRLVSDGSARRRFVVGVVGFLRRHNFRGLHLDWLYPVCWQSNCHKGPASDKSNFNKLIQELRKEFNKQNPPLILAAGISGYKEVIDVAYDLPSLGNALDFISVMTYDYHGAWERKTGHVSPLYHKPGDQYPQYNTNFTMEYLVSKGAPREKLLTGIPFYGQTFTLTKTSTYGQGIPSAGPGDPGEYTKQPGMLAYYEICHRIRNSRWIVNRDSTGATGPYAYYREQWVGYEDVDSARQKSEYVKSQGFGGVVAWTIDLDDFSNRCCGGSFPLLRSINRGLGLISDTPSQEDCTRPPQPVTPAPPQTTTGVDSGAQHTTEHMHHPEWTSTTTKRPTTTWKPSTWWSTSKPTPTNTWWPTSSTSTTTTTRKPSTTTSRRTTTRTTTTRPTTTTTRRTTTTTIPSWQQTTTPQEGTTIPSPAIVMPEIDNKPTQPCQLGQYLPDQQNCNAYYRCVLGELRKQYCAGGLHWNKERNICDWPKEAKCEKKEPYQKPPAPTATPSTSRLTTTKTTTNHWEAEPTSPISLPTTTTIRPTKSPVIIGENQCNSGAYYPHEQCQNFYVCVNGQPVAQSCAPGLYWNVAESMCDWRHKVKCLGRDANQHQKYSIRVKLGQDKGPQPYSSCAENSFAPHPGDCKQYLHCLWGKYETYQCAPGLHWNNERQICDWPRSAHCDTDDSNSINQIDGPTSTTTRPPLYPSTVPTSTPWPQHTTQGTYPDWKPSSESTTPSTTTAQWQAPSTSAYPDWGPPIPPTSPKPPYPEPLKPLSGYFKIVCYFTNWAWYRKGAGRYLPEDVDPELCTHIVYGFAVLDFERLIIKAHDSWADYDNRFYKRLTDFKSRGVKVSLALGGWNDSQGDKYSRLVNNPAARARFIKHALEFLEKYDFDGLDLDWEYPKCWQVDCKKGPDSDKQGFAAWVSELKQAFRPKGYLLSAAVSPSKTVIDAGYDVPVLAENLDWVAVMTYDFHGQWDKQTGHVAPLYYHPDDEVAFYNANFSINYWISEGVPRRKIVMGMPLYGQAFHLEKESNNGLNAKAPGPGEAGEFTRAAGFLAYYEICHNIKTKGWTVVKDPKRRMGPYAYKGNQWVSFDDKEMIRLKSEYIRKMDLGGGMIWALDLDDFRNRCGEGRHPLLSTIRNVLADKGTGRPEPIPPIDHEEPEPIEPISGEPEKDVKKEDHSPPPSVESSSLVAPPDHSTTSELQPIVNPYSEFKVVCYFTNWAWYRQGIGKYVPSDIDPDLCTHIVYGFAVLDGDQLIIKPHDTWADFDNKFYEKVTAYKAKGIKVLVAIGGWNDSAGDKYSRLVNNPSARRRFIGHVVDFIETNNFDGLDLDWEYPRCWQVDCNKGPASDKPAFASLVKELREAFDPKGWLLSAAVSPSRRVIDSGYDVPVLSQYLDWIAVMCYDYHGQWDKITGHVAPMYVHPEDADAGFNTNSTIHYWIEQGADRKKLVMGMPMYGQSFSLADNNVNGLNAPTYGGGEAGEETRARGFLAYYEICTNVINKGWTVVRDRKGRIGPYAYLRDQWVSFDDIGMIRHKSEYIKAMGLGGGMIWALDLDDFKNICDCEEYPLLRTINRVLRDYAKPDPNCILGKTQMRPTKKPTTSTTTTTELIPTKEPTEEPQEPQEPILPPENLPCEGNLFVTDKNNCNQYYLCNQGQLELQVCPNDLYWNKDHCDWPENTECHPDSTQPTTEGTTTEGYAEPEVVTLETTKRPYRPGTTSSPPPEGKYKVVCYFTNWAWYRQGDGKYLPQDIDSNLCTHINYGFAVLDSTSLTIKPHDSWADIDNDFYAKVVSYKSKGIKVLIALGGWNDSLGNKYSRLVNDPRARARFIAHVMEFIEKWGFDGLDLDWEYPKCWQVDCNKGPDSDKEAFASLVRELSEAFTPKGLLLSAAVSPSKAVIDAGYDVPTLSRYMDWIAVMTYDFHGHWDKQTGHVAPLYYYPGDNYDYFNANFSLNYWIEKGADPSKIIMGMPLYGQSFSLASVEDRGLNAKSYGPGEAGEFTRAGGFLAFYEICEKVKHRGWTVKRDLEGRIGPYAYKENQWVSYDDIDDIRRKSALVKDLDLGGGMIWALDLDDFKNKCGCGKHPLLKTLNNELRGTPSDITLENCT